MDWIQQWQSKLNKQNGVAPLVRTGGSRHTGLAALPHRNIHFDLGKLPEETLRKEFENYIRYRGTKVSILTIKTERNYFNSLCEFLQKPSNQVKSLMERDENVWIKQLKAWMLQKGRALTKAKKRVYQNESVEKVALIRYFENIIQFTVDLSETNEL